MEQKELVGKNVLYRTMNGTGYGKVERILVDDEQNLVVKVKGSEVRARVDRKDIIKVYG